jgi:hypothetical protein
MIATQQQISDLGKASRELLRFGWRRSPRLDLLIINGLTAVGKTFATDPSASAALLRQAIEPRHLTEHGYQELRWIAQEINTIAKADRGLAVDIYRAAYGYAEESGDSTDIGSGSILPLRSNRRQDYQGAWFLLSEAMPSILQDNLETGVHAIVASLDGYVRREHIYPHSMRATETFQIGSHTASFTSDWSHTWYRGGYQPNQDAPVLLKKLDNYLDAVASDGHAHEKIDRIVTIVARETDVVAAIWGSLLVAGAQHPSVYAQHLLPLACAVPIMLSSDTRYQLGLFINAAYQHFDATGRSAVEHSILALPGDEVGERNKQALVGCIPKPFIETAEMLTYRETLERAGTARPNAPPYQITTSTRAFDTDAYLESEGVSLEDKKSAALRDMLRRVEALVPSGQAQDLSLRAARRALVTLDALRKALISRFRKKVPDTLFDLATGQLAEAAGRIARAKPAILATASVKRPLKRILLFCATSENPRYSAKHENSFHESLSWGGPSARTAAAHGLLDLTRASKRRDPKIMTAIRKLARDRVPEVRLQIVQNLGMLRELDRDWAWSELEHVFSKEKTRGVVGAAIEGLPYLAYQDIARAIRAATIVIRRYRGKSGRGMAHCRSLAKTFIFDLHIHGENEAADRFAKSITNDIRGNADLIRHLIARYSDTLLMGSLDDPEASDNKPRLKTLAFYRLMTEMSFSEIDERIARLGINTFATWPELDQAVVRDMFGILEEVTLRLHFAAGTHYDGSVPVDEIAPGQARLYWEAKPIFARLAVAMVAPIAHHLVQTLENFIPLDPSGVFALIAQSVKSADQGGYSTEHMAADLIVRIVERYLADYRSVFAEHARMSDLMDCLDAFVRAGWPSAQSLTFKLAEIWR